MQPNNDTHYKATITDILCMLFVAAIFFDGLIDLIEKVFKLINKL